MILLTVILLFRDGIDLAGRFLISFSSLPPPDQNLCHCQLHLHFVALAFVLLEESLNTLSQNCQQLVPLCQIACGAEDILMCIF